VRNGRFAGVAFDELENLANGASAALMRSVAHASSAAVEADD